MQKIIFKNLPDTSTPLNASTLNQMQDNIETAINTIELMGGGDEVGTVKMFSGSTAPQGWLICDGSAISRSEYAELFSAIGTAYGSGNGTTTFNIPNIKSRTVVGLDSNDTDFDTLGETGGEKINSELNCGSTTWGLTNNLPGYMDRTIVKKTPISQTHEEISAEISNVQPYIVLNYIIKASATTTTQGQIIDSLSGDSTTDAPSVHAVNEKFDEITTPSYCVATITNSQAISSNYKVNLNKIENSQGNFELSNGSIIIGSGISKIKVSGSIFIDGWPGGSSYLWGIIRKNGIDLASSISGSTASYLSASIPVTIFNVNEGDAIDIMADSGAGGSLRSGVSNTWLCVEKIQ